MSTLAVSTNSIGLDDLYPVSEVSIDSNDDSAVGDSPSLDAELQPSYMLPWHMRLAQESLSRSSPRILRSDTQDTEPDPPRVLLTNIIGIAHRTDARAVVNVPLAEWEGSVTSVEDHSFLADLRGLSGQGVANALEAADIPISDVRHSDLPLLRPGAFFRLCVSYEKSPAGGHRRYTEIIFRRLPAYSPASLEEAHVRARELYTGLNVE